MKRQFSILACLVLALVMVFALASCENPFAKPDQPDEPAHTHTFVEGKCECGETDPEYVAPECEHAYGYEVTTEPNCTDEGVKTFTCTLCGHSYTQSIAPLGHTEETVEGKAPTCTAPGLSNGKKCSVCGETITAQNEINATGHTFVEGACSVCGEVDPNYNGPKTYVFESATLEKFAQGAKADGDTELVGTDGFFKLIYSAKTKVDDTSNKQWEDGYAIGTDKVNRLAWSASSYVNDAEEGTKNVVEIVVDGTATVKVWWVCGGDGRQVAIYNADGTIYSQTEIESAKNSPYLAEFSIDAAGTYYIGNVGGANYYLKLAATVTPAEEAPKNEIKVETTDTYTMYNLDFFTFTATAEGYYTFKIPAGLGAMVDGSNAPEVDYYMNENGGEFTVGLEAGQEIVVWVSATTKDMWTIEWSFEAGEVENQPDDPIEGDATELVVGSNNVVFADGELSQGKTYPFTVTEEGTYTFRSDLMAVVMDADGNTIGRGQASLTPGTYSVTLFSMMPLPSNSFTVNITFEAPSTGEPDGSEENPFVWETLPESVTFESDNMNMVYYVFTATADGSVTLTWAVEGNDWFNYFELVDGMTTANNASGYAKTSHTFVVETGKTYRIGLGTWNEGGETVVTIAFSACAHEWSEATCETLSTCSKCGATTGDYADHIPNSENPTCGDPAECTVCGTQTSYVPHSWDEGVVTQQPDCSTETNGSMTLTCTVCGETQTEDIWYSHDWVIDENVEVTCTTDGYYKAHCSVCNKIDEETSEAQGHYNWYAACGETTTCMECGTEFTKNHEGSPATCTEPMYCYNCWEYVGEPLGHTEGDAATCTTAQICTVCEAELVAALGHADDDYNGYCETCEKYFLPEAGVAFKLQLVQATLGKTLYFTGAMNGYYYATGDYNAAIDLYIEEADGGFNIYFLDGETKNYLYVIASGTYINVKIGTSNAGNVWTFNEELGTLVTDVNGTDYYIGTYGTYNTISASKTTFITSTNVNVSQFAARAIVVPQHEHSYSDATCTKLATCIVCGLTTGELLDHSYDDGVVTAPTCTADGYTTYTCENCSATKKVDGEAALGHTTEAGTCERCNEEIGGAVSNDPITASKTIKELITQYGWTSSTTKQSFTLDDVVSVKINGGSNTGKAYNGDHIRIYATDSPAGTITISVAEGYELVSIKISTVTGTYAFLYVDGTTTDISNQTVEVSGSSVLLNSVKNGSDGKQVRVTGIEVIYKAVG